MNKIYIKFFFSLLLMNHEINLNDPNSIQELQDILNHFEDTTVRENGENQYIIEFEFLINDQHSRQIDELPNRFKTMKEIDESLGKAEYIKKNNHEIIGQECVICTDTFQVRQYKRTLHCCKNIYHKKCIDKWLKKNSSCPFCRFDFIGNQEN